MKRFSCMFAALAAVFAMTALPALAGPLAYYNQPFDTPNSATNALIGQLNGTTGIPTAQGLQLATSVATAVTLNAIKGQVTTESLSTAHGVAFADTLTDSLITAQSIILVSVAKGTATTGLPCVGNVLPSAGSAVISINNCDAAAAFNGTLVYSFLVVN